MDDPPQMVHPVRQARATGDAGAVALRTQLDATRAALAEETRRRETAQAAWAQELRGHEATRAALADERRRREAAEAGTAAAAARGAAVARAADAVLQAVRGLMGSGQTPATTTGGPVAARLASVLEVLDAPPVGDPAERARRFALVRARLAGEG
jgi:membrane protein involved in colicin uptake